MHSTISQPRSAPPRLDELLQAASAATEAGDHARAVKLYRRAVDTAPFRRDLRDLLSNAMDLELNPPGVPNSQGKSASGHAPVARGRATFDHGRRGAARSAAPPASTPPGPRPVAPKPVHRRMEPVESPYRPRRASHPETAAVDTMTDHGSDFSVRHRKGPVSAIVVGGLVGFIMVAGVILGFMFTVMNHDDRQAMREATAAQNRAREISDQARRYIEKGQFSLAIDQYSRLPEEAERGRLLAETYIAMGDQALNHNPPQLESAREAYSKAVQYEPSSTEYGVALGNVMLLIAGQSGLRESEVEAQLQGARKIFEAVLETDRGNLAAHNGLAKVGLKLGDRNLQVNSLRSMIEVAPDSPEADGARRNLAELGLL